MTHHLAQINIGRMIAPTDDPRVADFMSQLDAINAIADRAPGFIWRLQSGSGNATDIAYNDDPFVHVNMSVWESLESLHSYVYRSDHIRVMRDRAKWFEKLDKAYYCLWWIPIGHLPTVAEGRDRLEHYQRHGSTPYSFWFNQPFPMPELVASPA